MKAKTGAWMQRFCKARTYIRHGDWRGLKQELVQYLVWKRVLSAQGVERTSHQHISKPGDIPILWSDARTCPERISPFRWGERFEDFLVFEGKVFKEDFPIAAYDPHLIRYGEYRFALEILPFLPGEIVVDLGCGYNIFGLYLAYLGVRVLAIDADPRVWEELQRRKSRVEQTTGKILTITFRAEDATELQVKSESVDKVIAISSIEHMFSEKGPGDILALKHIARILKPGGWVVITLPMNEKGVFHESPRGDERFGGPYRLYTPQALTERILSCPDLEKVALKYLAYTTPDPRYLPTQFIRFWRSMSHNERERWAWAYALLSSMFNPVIPEEEGKHSGTLNTALICLRKIA